ncbi:MAG: hypothetical protein J6K95_02305 [Rikenellaceae bacterium]|nr:hypothetical protein [Rikenellaceae bacterium]
MLGFTPFKKRPNQFEYKPRYYDPEKEAREQRRRELCGEEPSGEEGAEYVPGSFIRGRMSGRLTGRVRREESRRRARSMMMSIVALGLLLIIGYFLIR